MTLLRFKERRQVLKAEKMCEKSTEIVYTVQFLDQSNYKTCTTRQTML